MPFDENASAGTSSEALDGLPRGTFFLAAYGGGDALSIASGFRLTFTSGDAQYLFAISSVCRQGLPTDGMSTS